MFGFLGTGESNLTWEANGVTDGTQRSFPFSNPARYTYNVYARAFFDYDDVNSVKATQEALSNTTNVTYTGKPKTLMGDYSVASGTAVASAVIGGSVYGLNRLMYAYLRQRRFRYTSNTVLSPATRKVRVELPYYDTKALTIHTDNLTGSTAAANTAIGDLTVNLNKFPYVESFYLNGAWLDTLKIIPAGNALKYVVINTSLKPGFAINSSLPDSVLSLVLNVNSITSVATLLANCTNLLGLYFYTPAGSNLSPVVGGTSTLTGTLDISHLTALKEFTLLQNAGLTNVILPSGKTDWEWFQMANFSAAATVTATVLDNILASPNLRVFSYISIGKSYSKNIGNSEISGSLLAFYCYLNSWAGAISITTVKPNVKEFKTGNNSVRTGQQQNNFSTVDISGLTNVVTVDMSGSNISNLQLPVNTVCQYLNLMDNRLDVVTNPNLITQIQGMTALNTLLFGQTGASPVGQGSSVNGLGANIDFSMLTNLVTLSIENCKITGSLTLYNGNKITTLYLGTNPGLTNIVNLSAHTGLVTFYAPGCSSLGITTLGGSTFTALNTILASSLPSLASIDLSGKTTTTQIILNLNNCNALTTVTFPATEARAVVNSNGTSITVCSSLTSLVNVSNLNYSNVITGLNAFTFNNNALNITFPFGAQNFIPRVIAIQNNGMSQANVDATIMSMHTNRVKWDTYTAAKSLNIAGTNAAASGTYQAPAVAGSPANAKEAIWELINTKGWAITYN